MVGKMRVSEREESRASQALRWIVDALERHNVPYQIVGGAAARAYGAYRELVDIDIYIPFDEAASLLEEIQPYVTWGPQHHSGGEWDLTFLQLNYGGQKLELGDSSSEPRFFDHKNQRWVEQRIGYERSTTVELFGFEVKVMPKEELVEYKAALGREVDRVDLEQIFDG
jgi:hypothetical protein